MYSADEVGKISAGNFVQTELVKHHARREKKATAVIQSYRYNNTYVMVITKSAYSPEVKADIPSSLQDFEKLPLERLPNKTIAKKCLSELMEIEKFLQWLQLSFGSKEESWFHHLLFMYSNFKTQFEYACKILTLFH